MEPSTMELSGFASEAAVLREVATTLGRYGREGKQAEFVRTLEAMGMGLAEAEGYWQARDPGPENGVWWNPTTNTELASLLGIRLSSERFPRNLLMYRLAQQHFPDVLRVRVTGLVHLGGKAGRRNPPERRLVHFDKGPTWGTGDPMPVYQLYQGVAPAQFSAAILRSAALLRDGLGGLFGLKLAEFLFNYKMLIPPVEVSHRLALAIAAGQTGQEVTVVGAFCPDYTYEQTGNPQIPYRYTFDGVGEGVGLVAQQFARIVPAFSELLTAHGVQHRVVLGIGDFEADSQAVLDRVGLTRSEFVRRCAASLEAFRALMPVDVPLTLELFASARGQERFRACAAEATEQLLAGNFGCMPEVYDDLAQVMAQIPRQYRTFYERWYGCEMGDEQVRGIVYAQGGEYAAVARIYREDFGEHVIILAGDRPEMHRFNAFFQRQATLCAKRAY